jgi:hypothetical protein
MWNIELHIINEWDTHGTNLDVKNIQLLIQVYRDPDCENIWRRCQRILHKGDKNDYWNTTNHDASDPTVNQTTKNKKPEELVM